MTYSDKHADERRQKWITRMLHTDTKGEAQGAAEEIVEMEREIDRTRNVMMALQNNETALSDAALQPDHGYAVDLALAVQPIMGWINGTLANQDGEVITASPSAREPSREQLLAVIEAFNNLERGVD